MRRSVRAHGPGGERRVPADDANGPIERVASSDLAMRAMDAASAMPAHLAVLLLLDGHDLDPVAVREVLARRLVAVRRLRRRLVRVPVGCGRPVWVAADPDVGWHVRMLRCPAPGDRQAVLGLAAEVAAVPLPTDRPLWRAAVLTGCSGGRLAVLLVLHHAVADGLAGLAVLGELVDGVVRPGVGTAPPRRARRPPAVRLAADAAIGRLRAAAGLPAWWRALRSALRAGGGLHAPPAAPCSLLRPTGRHRRLAVATAELADVRAAAHRCGGSVNDALLVVVGGALRTLLAGRGEAVDTLRIAVPVAACAATDGTGASPGAGVSPGAGTSPGAGQGNANTPLVVGVATVGDRAARVASVSAQVREQRAAASGPSLPTVAGPLWRGLAGSGLYHRYADHQRRIHTVVSNLRGPDRRLSLAGAEIEEVVPLSLGETGNVVVGFLALSYGGTLTVVAIADPEQVPDLPVLATALRSELDALTAINVG